MNNPGARRPASTAPVPRPTGAVYRPPPPTSQANVALQQQQRNLPSSNLQQPQPRHNQQFHTPPAHQQLNRVRENTPPMNESQSVIEDSVPPSSQQQSQYNSQYYPSAQPEYHRPQSAHPRTVDMYRPGLPQGSMLVPATQSTNTTLMRSTSSQHLGPPKVTNSEKVIAAVSRKLVYHKFTDDRASNTRLGHHRRTEDTAGRDPRLAQRNAGDTYKGGSQGRAPRPV